MLKLLLDFLRKGEAYYKSIPEDDLIARQRYRLFRTTTIAAGSVIFLAFIDAWFIVDVGTINALCIGFLDLLLVINYFSLPYHKNNRIAYYTIVLAAFATLHIVSYDSGGIRASAVMYMVGNMLLAYMLLGKKAGRWMFVLTVLNIAYFYYLTTYTSVITYTLIGDTADMINTDYLITFGFSMFILSSQMSYLESGKNEVIQRITLQRNELREKNRELNKLSMVASKADNAITITDENGVAEWVNDGFTRLTGYAIDEVQGRDPLNLLLGIGSSQQQMNELRNAMKAGQPFTGELLKYKKDRTRFWSQITMTPIAADDESGQKFIFIESDITPRKIVEEKMHLYLKNLEKTNRELDKFAYVVSHDLKAPLRAIGNLTGWIEEDMGDRLPEDVRTHFNTIKGRVVRMEGLINGILDYTKAAKKDGEMESFRLDELLRDTIDLIGAPPNAVIHVPDNLPVMKTEKIKLQQVFLNLIHNAVKYNDKENILIDLSVEDQDVDWKFSVRDNGPGIEKRYHDKIFVIFQTLNARDEVESRGVGLAIVKKIVEEEGGRIWIESEKGLGAKFCFTWPKVKAQPMEESLMAEVVEAV